MIQIEILVNHAGGSVSITELAPVTDIDDEATIGRSLDAAVRRAHLRAKTALIQPIEDIG